MKNTLSLLIALLLLPALALAQADKMKLKGRIMDASDHSPIPFVSIGIEGKDVGTVSNELGGFELYITGEYAADTLVFSMIGYEQQRHIVENLAQALQAKSDLTLDAVAYTLQTFDVTGHKLSTKVLGNQATPSGVGMTPFKFSNLGNEIGILCKVKDKPTYLEEFNVDIFLNDYDTLFFRLNVYTLENGQPKENILAKPIYVEFTGKKGKASINLQPYDIVVNEDFVVSLEYVKKLRKIDLTRKDQAGLYFGARKMFGGTVYTRSASHGSWIASSSGLFAPKMEVVVKN